MRNIRFRGISKETNEFIFGYLSSNGESFYIGTHGENYRFDEVKEYSIGQFTGLYDKNGVEIYEGDIMYFKEVDLLEELGYYEIYVPVVFQNGAFGWIGETNKSFISFDNQDLSDHKIIGNIHLNPELIK